MGVELEKWIEKVKRCEYLAEEELKLLCDYVGGAGPRAATGSPPSLSLQGGPC
jgi:hypothetical protein